MLDLRTDTYDALMAFSAMEAEALHRNESPLRFPVIKFTEMHFLKYQMAFPV